MIPTNALQLLKLVPRPNPLTGIDVRSGGTAYLFLRFNRFPRHETVTLDVEMRVPGRMKPTLGTSSVKLNRTLHGETARTSPFAVLMSSLTLQDAGALQVRIVAQIGSDIVKSRWFMLLP